MIKQRVKNLVKRLMPAKKYGYFGDFKSWAEVEKMSSGYSSDIIIEKVRVASLKVKRGEIAYERDSVEFNKIDMSWPLLAGLLWIASRNDNSLELIDFGGSLGTSYYQNKTFLSHLKKLKWHIIEQDKFVDIGNREFKDDQLDFYKQEELETLTKNNKPQVMIISSSLQFLKEPRIFIQNLSNFHIPYIIFDKIPFFVKKEDEDRLMLQKVSPKIYDASYPVWIFGVDNFLSQMSKQYELISDFDAYSGHIEKMENGEMCYKGFIFKRK